MGHRGQGQRIERHGLTGRHTRSQGWSATFSSSLLRFGEAELCQCHREEGAPQVFY